MVEDEIAEKWLRDNYERVTALMMDLSDSVDLLLTGLSHLRKLEPNDHRYAPGLVMLAVGFERLLRSALVFAFLRDNGRLPEAKEFGQHKHHDLLKLWECVADACPQASPAIVAAMVGALDEATDQHRVLCVLDDQAQVKGRYLRQKVYLGQAVDDVEPSVKISSGAMIRLYRTGRLHPYLDAMIAGEGDTEESHAATQQEMEEASHLAATVAALFSDGALGDFAREFSGLVQPLLPESESASESD